METPSPALALTIDELLAEHGLRRNPPTVAVILKPSRRGPFGVQVIRVRTDSDDTPPLHGRPRRIEFAHVVAQLQHGGHVRAEIHDEERALHLWAKHNR